MVGQWRYLLLAASWLCSVPNLCTLIGVCCLLLAANTYLVRCAVVKFACIHPHLRRLMLLPVQGLQSAHCKRHCTHPGSPKAAQDG